MKFPKSLTRIMKNINKTILDLNTSKAFAGIMIITLNISARFVDLKLSKSFESYLKNTFSRQVLVFAIAWMGTRDIYVSLGVVLLFTVVVDYLCNENSDFCCFSDEFKTYHIELMENRISDQEIAKAKEVLKKAEEQKS